LCEFEKKMLNKWKILTKFTNHKIEKKKEKRKNTDNICIWYTRYKYYAVTKPASILVSSYKSFVFVSNY
jgi:hypothetical protein